MTTDPITALKSIRAKRLSYTVVARKMELETKRGSAGATAKPQGHHTSKGHMMTKTNLTSREAAAAVRYFLVDWHENTQPLTLANYMPLLTDFTADLSTKIGATISWAAVDTALDVLDQIAAVENGTHPDLIVNKTHTVDNTTELLEKLDMDLTGDISWIVTSAKTTAQAA